MSFYEKTIRCENGKWLATIGFDYDWILLAIRDCQMGDSSLSQEIPSIELVDRAVIQCTKDIFEGTELIKEAVLEGYELMPDEYYRDSEEYAYVPESSSGYQSVHLQKTDCKWELAIEFDEHWLRSAARKFIDAQFSERIPNYAVLPLSAIAGMADEWFNRCTEHLGYQVAYQILSDCLDNAD